MRRQQGISLIELIIFIVIVSIGVVGILSVFNVTVKTSADPLVRKQSMAIAEAMLDEIFAKNFKVGGYSKGDNAQGDRAQFDDVSDYADYDQTGIKALDGSPIDGLENYTVTVNVKINPEDALGLPDGDIKKITVAVTSDGNTMTLIAYRANYE